MYTIKAENIKNKILRLYAYFIKLLQTLIQSLLNFYIPSYTLNDTSNDGVQKFNRETDFIFDIFCENEATQKRQKNVHGVKMSEQK